MFLQTFSLAVTLAAGQQGAATTAQQPPPPPPVTESVVVFGGATSVWRDPSTGETTLSREDLQRVPAMTPDESLKVLSGFSLFRRSSSRASNPTTHGVTMRGLSASGASRALIMVDGVPLNDGFGGWVTWERLPSDAIDQISVQRGPVGDAFGTDALGGVIKLVTPQVARRFGAGGAEFASLNTTALNLSGAIAGSRARLFGAAGWFSTDGFIPVEPKTRGAVDVPTDTKWSNAYGKAVFGSAHRLTVSGWGGADDRGNGTVLQRNSSHGGTGTAAFESSSGATQFAARLASSVNRYEQTFSAVLSARATERLTSTQHIDADVLRGIAEVRRTIPRGVVAARASFARTDAKFDETTTTATSSSDLVDNSQSISTQIAIAPVSQLTLTAGGRAEWRNAGVSAAPVSPKPATVGRLSAAWRPTAVVTMRAAAGSSHRWPTLNELVRNFSAGTATTLANPDLGPERARSIEAGIDVSQHGLQASVTGFRSVVHDAIANVTLSQVGSAITRQRRNAGDAHAAGVEFDASAQTSLFRVRASATVLNARFTNSKEAALEDKWLPQVPRVSAGGSLDILLPRQHVASLVVHHASTQFDDDKNTAAFLLASATEIDARLGGTVKSLRWYVAAENLADARLETGRSGSATAPLVTLAQGRAFRAGLTITLPAR